MWEQIQGWLDIYGVEPAVIVIASVLAAAVFEFAFRATFIALARKTQTDLDDQIAEALRRPIFVSVILYGLTWAVEPFALPARIEGFTYAILETIAVFVWAAAGFRISHAALGAYSKRATAGSLVQPRTVPVFEMLTKIAIVGAAVYFTFLAWDIDVTAWLASAGIIGIAVGFAAKDTLANLFSGIFILADAPYKIGDWIVLDGGLRGRVTKIGVRSTRILTRDDIEITVPNAVIGNSKIVNEAGGPYVKQRVPISVSAAYGSDIDLVRQVLLSCPEGMDQICAHPEPQVRFRSFGGSGLEFQLLVWIEDPALRGLVRDILNCKVYKSFAAAGIEIPYSKHDVYIKELARASGAEDEV